MTIKSFISKTLSKFHKQPLPVKLLIALAVIFLLRYLVNELMGGAYLQSSMLEGFSGQGKEFTLFYWKDCGHCKKMMPEWQRFVKLNANNKKVKIETVEKDDAPELIQKYNVQGFPTIIAINDGKKVKEFDGERTVDDLQRFTNSI